MILKLPHHKDHHKAVFSVILGCVLALSNPSITNYRRLPSRNSTPSIEMPGTTGSASRDVHSNGTSAPRGEKRSVSSPALSRPVESETVSPVPPEAARLDEVKQYLWNIYQRSGTKVDSHGDFTWKDAAAADRLGLSTEDYVIGGMDPDFREQLFAAGQAMDMAGIDWTILSAFRDDYRQSLAVGFKAQIGNSFHGGSSATGGYGHGCAVDVASTDGDASNYTVWNWLDQHGRQFGLHRPLGRVDPAHVQPSAGWHELATILRNEQTATDSGDTSGTVAGSYAIGSMVSVERLPDHGVTEEQFSCVRPRLAEEPNHISRIVSPLRALITPLRIASAESGHSRTKWRTAAGAPLHRVTTRRSPSQNLSHHATLKARLELAG